MAGALLSCLGWSIASAQAVGDAAAFPGRIYNLHTPAGGGCPSFDWHVIVGDNNSLSGLIGLDEMKVVFNVVGNYSSAAKSFQLTGTEIGGSRIANIKGQVQTNGRMAASLSGLPVDAACQAKNVSVQWVTAAQASGN